MTNIIKNHPHCVQCGDEMVFTTTGEFFHHVCHNTKCPNFGLLQIGIEKMRKAIHDEKNTNK